MYPPFLAYSKPKGALIYDGCIGAFDSVQQQVPVVPFIEANKAIMGLDDDYIDTMKGLHESCGFKGLVDKHLTFPPTALQPMNIRKTGYASLACDLFSRLQYKMMSVNKCFDIYMVNQTCPKAPDPITASSGRKAYFDRSDVKAALHAPTSVKWAMCGVTRKVFTGGYGGPQREGNKTSTCQYWSYLQLEQVIYRLIQ